MGSSDLTRTAPTDEPWSPERHLEEAGCVDNLVLCPCGHSLANHDYVGCSGDRLRNCACARDRHAALEAAVDSARTSPVFSGGYAVSRNDDAA